MTTAIRAGREQVLAFRLAGHSLAARRSAGELLAVAGACGVRNTPPGSAALGLDARLDGLPPDALDRALGDDKALVEVLSVRASPLLVPTRDLAVFTLGALPRDEASLRAASASLAPVLAEAGIPATEALRLAVEAARAELAGGMLSRAALSAGMTRRLPAGLRRWCAACKAHHVGEMLFRLVGVAGVWVMARRGKDTGYVLADAWLGDAGARASAGTSRTGAADPPGGPRAGANGERAPAKGEDAVEEARGAARAALLRRYLACFGPSTVEHFAAWVGIATAEARPAWEALAERLAAVEHGGTRAWLHRDDLARFESPPTARGVRLLPPYDAYLDQRDRATLLPDTARHARVWRAIGNPGVVLADGEIVATWRPKKQGRRLVVRVEAFAPLSATTREEVEAEAARLAPLRGCASAAVEHGR